MKSKAEEIDRRTLSMAAAWYSRLFSYFFAIITSNYDGIIMESEGFDVETGFNGGRCMLGPVDS
ncbi:hypothetical protein GGGNBK_07955 [Sporosarcina sp. ANT_H38]